MAGTTRLEIATSAVTDLVILNGADSPSLVFEGILRRNLSDPNRTQVFDFTFPDSAVEAGAPPIRCFISQTPFLHHERPPAVARRGSMLPLLLLLSVSPGMGPSPRSQYVRILAENIVRTERDTLF